MLYAIGLKYANLKKEEKIYDYSPVEKMSEKIGDIMKQKRDLKEKLKGGKKK